MTIITTKNGLASTDVAGPIKVATEAEAIAGVDSTKAITPATLESAVGAQVQDLDDRITNLETGGVPPAGSASQIELDATQAGAGLEANGNYSANGSANYIATATSLKDADTKLDAQIKANADQIASDVLVINNSIALKADQADVDAIDTRLTTAEGEIDTLQTDAAALAGRVTTAEGDIDSVEAAVALKASQADLDAAELSIADHEGRIQTLEAGGGTAAVQAELDDTQTAIGLAADGSYVQPSGSNFLDTSTTIMDALDKLDVAVADAAGQHTDITALETRVTTAEGEIDALEAAVVLKAPQNEVDAIEVGVGLSSAGAYVAPSGSNYIDASTSVMDALDKLDQAVWDAEQSHTDISALEGRMDTAEADIDQLQTDVSGLQTSASNLQTEVDGIEAGAGLNGNGSYTANAGANYISTATSLKDADDKLDAQIKTNADAIALKASLTQLQTLGDRVTVNEGDIATIETSLADKLEAADLAPLQTEIDAIETAVGLNANGSYSPHSGSNYLDTATSVKNALSLLDTEAHQHDLDIANIESQIDSIIASGADQAAVTALQNELDATQLGAGLTTTGAYNANGTSNYIVTATSLKDADNKLDAAIKLREDEIDALDVRITANEGDITALEGADITLQSNIDAKADQASLDSTNNELGTTQVSIGLNANGTYSAHVGSNYLDTATTVKGALSLADAAIKANEDDIVDHETRITANANAIASNDSDILTLQGADTTLQANIDAIEVGAGLDGDGGYTADATTNYLTAASSLKDADKKLDAQVKANADAIALKASDADLTSLEGRVDTAESDIVSLEGRMDAAESDITALETLADTHEASLGLNADGSRPAYSSTNYVSGTHHNAIGQLDAQAKANADAIVANDGDIAGLQTELDTTQTSVGLNANGSRPVYSSTNYVSGSHHAAIGQLDAQVRINELDIAAEEGARISEDASIRTEIDAVETGVGLAADGSYTTPAGHNYLGQATLKADLASLDTQVKVNSDAIVANDGDIAQLQTDLDAAELVIASHTNLLDTHESSIGLNADGSYTQPAGGNYTAGASLKASLEGVDAQVKINTDAIALKASQASLNTLQGEVDAIETAVGLNTDGTFNGFTLSNYMNDASSTRGALLDLDGQVKTNEDAIATETSNRIAANNAIQTELNTTQSGAGLSATGTYTSPAGNTYLGGASIKSDVALLDIQLASTQSDLDTAEASLAAAEGDIVDLQTLADTHEAYIGLNADGSRPNYSSNNYVANANDLVEAIGILDNAINGVAGADITNLQNEVNAVEAGAGLGEDGSYTANINANYIHEATSLKDADDKLDAALAAEATERANADAAFDQWITKLSDRSGGILIEDSARSEVVFDSTLSQWQGFSGPLQVSFPQLISSGESDIVFGWCTAFRMSDKNMIVSSNGDVDFTGLS